MKFLLIALILVVSQRTGCSDSSPPNGWEAYCYHIANDPRGEDNTQIYVTNTPPIQEGEWVTLSDYYLLDGQNWKSDEELQLPEIRFASDGDVEINSCKEEAN